MTNDNTWYELSGLYHVGIFLTLYVSPDDIFTTQLHKILKDKRDDATERNTKSLPVEEGCLSRGSVIVYVWRQKDTEVVAEQLIGAGVRGGVVCYHGGMDSNDRTRAQSKVSNVVSIWHPISSAMY